MNTWRLFYFCHTETIKLWDLYWKNTCNPWPFHLLPPETLPLFYPFAPSKGLAPFSIKMLFLWNCDLIPHLSHVFYKTKHLAVYSVIHWSFSLPSIFSPVAAFRWALQRVEVGAVARLRSKRLWCSFFFYVSAFQCVHSYISNILNTFYIASFKKNNKKLTPQTCIVISEFLSKCFFPFCIVLNLVKVEWYLWLG